MRAFVLLFLTALALGAGARSTGIQERISGGNNPLAGQAKYVVEVVQYFYTFPILPVVHLCAGALIDRQWVLTTVTCLNSLEHAYYRRLYVVGKSAENPKGLIATEGAIFKHEAYNQKTGENNIALVKLQAAVSISDTTACGVVSLPKQDANVTGYGMLAGFGTDRNLKVMDLRILEKEECAEKHVYPQNLCTEPGVGACDGDDGSPLTVPVGSEDWKLLGLATGTLPCNKDDVVGTYVNVARYSKWAETIMNKN